MEKLDSMYENTWNDLCTWERIKVEYPPHFHSYLELLTVTDGECEVTVDFVTYKMEPGDAVLVFPNVIHSYRSVVSPVKNLTFMLPPAYFPLFKDTFASYRPASPIIKGLYNNETVKEHMHMAIKENKSKTLFGPPTAAGHLAILLGTILPNLELVPSSKDISSEGRILAYCGEHFREPITLETLESDLHLSKFHISHLFNDRLNISFSRLLRTLRIDEACKLLKSGATVTTAAYSSGFGSLRNFNRAFAEDKGMTPSEYSLKHAKNREKA